MQTCPAIAGGQSTAARPASTDLLGALTGAAGSCLVTLLFHLANLAAISYRALRKRQYQILCAAFAKARVKEAYSDAFRPPSRDARGIADGLADYCYARSGRGSGNAFFGSFRSARGEAGRGRRQRFNNPGNPGPSSQGCARSTIACTRSTAR